MTHCCSANKAPTPATTNDAEFEAPAGANSRAERVGRVKNELRSGKPLPEVDHPVWDYFSIYVKEDSKCFPICLLCDRRRRHKQAEIKFNNESPNNFLYHLNSAKKRRKKTKGTDGGPLSP